MRAAKVVEMPARREYFCAIADEWRTWPCQHSSCPAETRLVSAEPIEFRAWDLSARRVLPWDDALLVERLRPLYRFLEDPLKEFRTMGRLLKFALFYAAGLGLLLAAVL